MIYRALYKRGPPFLSDLSPNPAVPRTCLACPCCRDCALRDPSAGSPLPSAVSKAHCLHSFRSFLNCLCLSEDSLLMLFIISFVPALLLYSTPVPAFFPFKVLLIIQHDLLSVYLLVSCLILSPGKWDPWGLRLFFLFVSSTYRIFIIEWNTISYNSWILHLEAIAKPFLTLFLPHLPGLHVSFCLLGCHIVL